MTTNNPKKSPSAILMLIFKVLAYLLVGSSLVNFPHFRWTFRQPPSSMAMRASISHRRREVWNVSKRICTYWTHQEQLLKKAHKNTSERTHLCLYYIHQYSKIFFMVFLSSGIYDHLGFKIYGTSWTKKIHAVRAPRLFLLTSHASNCGKCLQGGHPKRMPSMGRLYIIYLDVPGSQEQWLVNGL